jgi:hypothetical protein
MTATRTRTELTELETIRLRHLVEDHAGTYYGGPLQLGVYDAIRYTAEAVVERQFPDVTYDTLWDAIRAILNQDITALDRRLTDADRAQRAAVRRAAADAWVTLASQALDSDDPDKLFLASAFVDAAEREDPDYPGLATGRRIISARYEQAESWR